MKRNLLKQMGNEWRENVWMVLELFVVLIAVWFLMCFMVTSEVANRRPKGFVSDDVYFFHPRQVSSDARSFVDYGDDAVHEGFQDLRAIMARIRRSPYIESAAFSINALPYQWSFYGSSVYVDGDTLEMPVNKRYASPDIAKVMRYHGMKGETPEQLSALLASGEVLIGPSPEVLQTGKADGFIGRKLHESPDSPDYYISHALIDNIIRSDYEEFNYGTVVYPLKEDELETGPAAWGIWEIIVRVKPGCADKMIEEFKSDMSMRRHRNTFLAAPVSLNTNRDIAQQSKSVTRKLTTGCAVMLAVMVFLGILGTFWFRIRCREREIALRKVAGATSADIFRRLVAESVILVGAASLLGIAVVVAIASADAFPSVMDNATDYIVYAGVLSVALMILVAIAGVMIPALRAIKVNPAVILKDE